MNRQAIILAAGAGNRAKPFTETRPKCMFDIANKPLLYRAIDSLIQNGIRKIIIVVGYKKELIFDYLASVQFKDVEISFVEQSKLLGSSEALLECEPYLSDDDFIVLPADKYYTADTIAPIISAKSPTMLTQNPNLPVYATARNSMGQIAIGRFKHSMDEDPIDTRIYCLNKSLFNKMHGFMSINQAFNNLPKEGIKIYNIATQGIWADLVFPWDIITINELDLKTLEPQIKGTFSQSVVIRGNAIIEEGTKIGANSSLTGNVCIGKKCRIKENVVIEGSTSIGNSTIIEPLTYISNSVIGDNVHIGAGSIIIDSIIDSDTNIGIRFTSGSANAEVKIGNEYYTLQIGSMIGNSCTIMDNVSASAGTVIGNNVRINNNERLFGIIPSGATVI